MCSLRKTLLATVPVGFAVLTWVFGVSGLSRTAAQPPAKDFWKTGKFYGAEACQDCHALPKALNQKSLDFVLLTEYSTWTTYDKHSLAYVALACERGQNIGKLLGIKVTEDARCLNCHAINVPEDRRVATFSLIDGVNCEGCHGPAEGWLQNHQFVNWRKQSPQEKYSLGMRDVRDPAVKAEMCMSCHVGNAAEGKVVSHAMYAAGHPPLPAFDLALFSSNLPPHWRNTADVPYLQQNDTPDNRKFYHYQAKESERVKLTVPGSAVGLNTVVTLLADRSDVKNARANFGKRWPEFWGIKEPERSADELLREQWPEVAMIHAACYACHHDLQSDSWRQIRGYGGHPPGRPPLPRWPLDMTRLSLFATDQYQAEPTAAVADQLVGQWQQLGSAWYKQPFGDPHQDCAAAKSLKGWLEKLIESKLKNMAYDQTAALRLLRTLCTVPDNEYPDYDTARLIAAAVHGLCEDLGADLKLTQPARDVLKQFEGELSLKPYSGRTAREDVIKDLVAKNADPKVEKADLSANFSVDDVRRLKDPEKIYQQLANNKYLQTLRQGIANKKLRNALLEPESKERLQRINNEEIQAALTAARNYDPIALKKRLKEIEKSLPAQ
jgi:hypothetical protein